MSNAPCKNCEMKGCGAYHSQCEKYLKFREDCEKERVMRYHEANLNGYKRDCIKPKKRRRLNEQQ